ncbi:MAG: hypothetical protein J0I60_07090 [Nitrosospira sp.]|nr:hypothetical protein [Nitrosospira sp.]
MNPIRSSPSDATIARIGLEAAASQAGISKRRAYIWHSRWKESGERGLYDRSSRSIASPRRAHCR